MQLPEAWAEKMACPYCATRPLGVFHPTGQADRFVCQSCDTSFQLEDQGTRLRFVTLPDVVNQAFRMKWVPLEDALAEFASQQSKAMPSTSSDVEYISSPLDTDPRKSPLQNGEPLNQDLIGGDIEPANVHEQPEPSEIGNSEPDFMKDVLPTTSNGQDQESNPFRSPFHQEDLDIPGLQPDEVAAELDKPAKNVWQEMEMRRQEREDAENADSSIPSISSSYDGQTGTHFSRPLDLNNPPPIRPLEDTPKAAIPIPPIRGVVPPTDIEDLRRDAVVASNMPGVSERMQTAAQRAVELQKLGNTLTEVRSILERSSGLTPDQVGEVMKGLDKPEEKKRVTRFFLVFSIIAIAIFSLIAWWFFSNNLLNGGNTETPDAEETVESGGVPRRLVDPSSLPEPLQTYVPDGVRIFNDPPLVERASEADLPPTTCPTNKIEAASIFGGQAKDWSQEEKNNGWMMVTTLQGVEIKVPTGMSAGYLVFVRGPEMRSVLGPAVIRNIYMISISCS
jgi:hypothetical protein